MKRRIGELPKVEWAEGRMSEWANSFFAVSPSRRFAHSLLFFYSLFLAAATLLLILAGGLVTSHEAGLAVPDWPLSYGKFFPPMVGNVFWEHGHRMIAGFVGIQTLIFAGLVQWLEQRAWLKKLAWIAVAGVLLQALLGGLTVLWMLPAPVSIFHACLAQTFFCLVVSMAYFFRPSTRRHCEERRRSDEAIPELEIVLSAAPPRNDIKDLSLLTTGFIYLQLIFGATVRHTGHGMIPHVLVAFFVAIPVMLLVVRILGFHAGDKFLKHFALQLGFLTVLQIFLGMGSFVFTRMLETGYTPGVGRVFFTAAHQTTGAAVLATSVLIALRGSR